MKKLLIASLLCSFSMVSYAQEQDTISDWVGAGDQYILGLFPRQEPPPLRKISVGGFYRFFGTYTQMEDEYLLNAAAGQSTPERNLFIGDDSQLPNFQMNFAGRPNEKSSFNMDVYMFQFLDNDLGESYGQQVVDSLKPPVFDPLSGTRLGGNLILNLGINLNGSYETDYGSFTARMGGIQWYHMSDLTFSSFQGFNRFTLFERNPWDPIQRDIENVYRTFHQEGATQQDTRWGNRAFHGLILEGAQLPEDFSFSFLYGKTELNGGFTQLPNNSVGGRLRKDMETGFYGINSFNSRTYSDSLARSSIGFNVHTFEMDQKIEGFRVKAEIGAGRYYAPGYRSEWGEAVNIKLSGSKEKTGIPLELHYYRISPQVINNNAIFWNTSIEEVSNNELPAGVAGSNAALIPFASSVVPIGLMTNNRTGLNLNGEIDLGDFNVNLGYGVASEIEPISNQITYSHAVNQLTRSRFWRFNFPSAVGPYDRYSVVFRDAFETVNLTDDRAGEVVNRKHFSNLEMQAKYNTFILNKSFYAFLLGRYTTVQPEFRVIIPTNEDAYMRMYSTELETYWRVSNGIIWANYFGYERNLGNYDTDRDLETLRPRNQKGTGYGTGIDLNLGKNSVFTVRHRFFYFRDRNFAEDKFRGQETMVEIKTMF